MGDDDQRNFHLLETEIAGEMVWLMKCPPRVAKAWHDLSESSLDPVPVAKYFESVDPRLPDLLPESTMEMVGAELWNMPKLYSLTKSKDMDPIYIFSEANQGKVAVEGAVMHKVDMKPHCGIEEYSKICRERNRKQEDRQRKVLVDDREAHLKPMPEMVRKKTASANAKRTKSDRGVVEVKISKLFERQPKWTMKQLVQETNQPAVMFS